MYVVNINFWLIETLSWNQLKCCLYLQIVLLVMYFRCVLSHESTCCLDALHLGHVYYS